MKNILIIGGGNMGFAMASGIAKHGFKKKNILLIEKNPKRIKLLKKEKFVIYDDALPTLKKHKKSIEAIIIAVKPQDVKQTLIPLKALLPRNTLVISIAAGITLASIAKLLRHNQPIARVMPNTPCQVGYGTSVIAFNRFTNKQHKQITKKIFNSVGIALELKESLFDSAGAINGSGPAYFCYFIEALTQSGIKLGLSKNIAFELALQTSIGTNMLLNKKNIPPEVLRKAVTSPKGITEAALQIYKKRKLKTIVYNGTLAAKRRSVELGRQK